MYIYIYTFIVTRTKLVLSLVSKRLHSRVTPADAPLPVKNVLTQAELAVSAHPSILVFKATGMQSRRGHRTNKPTFTATFGEALGQG